MTGLAGTATSPRSSGSREHAHGFSSLSLLAGRQDRTRILYLLDWTSVTIATAASDPAESATLAVNGWCRLPLAGQSVDAVVADLDAAPDNADTRRLVGTELGRVLTPDGRWIAAITHRRRPRDPRDWAGYRLVPPVVRWREALRGAGFVQIDAARLEFDGPRITTIHLAPHPCRDGLPPGSADAVALVLARRSSGEPSVVEEMSRALGREPGAPVQIDRVHVRKIGKTGAFVADGGIPMVVRMPCSAIALARARRNYAALETLHGGGVDVPARLLPEPVGQGVAAGQPYFVETVVPGAPREERIGRIRWEPQALELITNLHVSTARPHLLSSEWFQQTIDPALSHVEGCELGGEEREAVARLRSILHERLTGQRLPLVRSHGDFTGGNCLYDRSGRLSGIVDWELSSADSLPLLDLVQLVDLPSEYTQDERWYRAELVFDAVEGRGPLFEAPEIAKYARALALPDALIPALLLAWWVDHAGARVQARQIDKRWFRRRVKAPLARLRRAVLSAGAPG